jgi:hypothetical protein
MWQGGYYEALTMTNANIEIIILLIGDLQGAR